MSKNKKENLVSNRQGVLVTSGSADIVDSLGLRYLEKLELKLNQKKFRVRDTSLTYRQINHLDETSVLPKDSRNQGKGWRKFSYKQLIFFEVVRELRKYGIKDGQLCLFRNAFFKSRGQHAHLSNLALGIALVNIQINLVFDGENKPVFYDDTAFHMETGIRRTSYIMININEIINAVAINLGEKESEYRSFSSVMINALGENLLNAKEKRLMKVIRNQDYQNIKIKKASGESYIIKAEKVVDMSEAEILRLIKEGSHHDIAIKKRDGKIQHIKKEDSIKI